MICYHINSKQGTITQVEFINADDLRGLVGGWLETAYMWPITGDTLYVDEEGLLKQQNHGFQFKLRPDQALLGNGVVVGREPPDEAWSRKNSNHPPMIRLDTLTSLVTFIRRMDID